MSSDPPRGSFGVERMAALSDGVFAIVLTLLVLELKVPEVVEASRGAEERALTLALVEKIPNFIAWLISFVLLARLWAAHHAIVASLARCHIGTITWNFLVLAVVSLIPFGASLIGTYEFDAVALGIFSAIFGLAGVALGLFARHAALETHLHRAGEPVELEFQWRYHATILPSVAVVAVLGMAIDESVALVVWAVEPFVALRLALKQRKPPKGE